MAINKNFKITNGLEVNKNLIFADTDSNKVGIATTSVNHTLHVNGGIGATNLSVTGVSTFSNLVLNGYVSAGGTVGNSAQILISTGTGVTWSTISKKSSVSTASIGQTSFSFSYEIGTAEVYINGVRLAPSEFTATDGSTVVLNDACFGDETVEIIGNSFIPNVVDGWTETSGGGLYRLSNVGVGTTNPQTNFHIIGSGTTALLVEGNARVTGILTIGTSSITLDGTNNTVSIGTVVIGDASGNANFPGIVTASSFVGDGSGLTNLPGGGGGSSQWVTNNSGIHTLSNVGIGTTDPQYSLDITGTAKISNLRIDGTQILGNGTYSTLGDIQLIPNDTLIGSGQYVKLRPTTNLDQTHIHIEAGDVNNADLYLGDDDRFVKIDHLGPVVIGVPSTTTSNWTALSDDGPVNYINVDLVGYPWGQYLTLGDTVTLPDTTVVNIINTYFGGNYMSVYLDANISYVTNDVLVFNYQPRSEWTFNSDSTAIFPGNLKFSDNNAKIGDVTVGESLTPNSYTSINRLVWENGTTIVGEANNTYNLTGLSGNLNGTNIDLTINRDSNGDIFNITSNGGDGNFVYNEQISVLGSLIGGTDGVDDLTVIIEESYQDGTGNLFVGKGAGRNTTSGGWNNFLGEFSGYKNTTGKSNNFFGFAVGKNNTNGNYNNFFGGYSGYYNTSGSCNNFFGCCSGYYNTSGSYNNFLGICAGYYNTTGDSNHFIGYRSGCCNTTGSHNIAIGDYNYGSTTGCGNFLGGYAAGWGGSYGMNDSSFNNFIGWYAGGSADQGSSYCNNFIGYYAGACNCNGGNNNFFGSHAGYCNTGSYNNFFGTNSGYNNTGGNNTFIGSDVGYSNTTGCGNNFIGKCSGYFNTSGYYNNFFGAFSGYYNTTGCYNSFFGQASGKNNTIGCYNSFFGAYSGFRNTTGTLNTFIGFYNGESTTSSNKVIIGSSFPGSYAAFDAPDITKDTQLAIGIKTDANPANYWLVGDENFNIGIGTTNPTSKLDVGGTVTATEFLGNLTGTATTASSVAVDSVGLGTHTYGDYIKDISGTANQITVTGGTGEGSSSTLSIPNQFTAPQDVTVLRDLQVNRNLNVNGNITIGGTSATLFTTEFKVYDPDIVLGFRTDGSGNDISTDNTANHGGIAIASTEGSPLINLYDVGIGETNPATYKKFMWFKTGAFSGLGTDAWLSNYAIGIGSTQFPSGTRLAAGSVQFTERDLASVRNINSSGIITTSSLNVTGTTRITGFIESQNTSTNTNNILSLDAAQGTVFTHTTTANIGIVSFTGISTSKANTQTFTVLVTQGAVGYNTTAATGIGTQLATIVTEGGVGYSTHIKVGSGTTMTLTSTPGALDILTFIVSYNGVGVANTSFTVIGMNAQNFRGVI